MENLFVFIIYNIFCVRFIDQLVSGVQPFIPLFKPVNPSSPQCKPCVCACVGVGGSTHVLRMCVRRRRYVLIRCKQAALWPRQVSLITVCLS